MSKALEKEFKYYLANQSEFVKKYDGKFIVIQGEKVIGVHESELQAVQESSKRFAIGTFLVQKVEPGDKGYTQTFHSRVAVAA